MPFADDVNLSRLPALAGNLFLVDTFAKPPRFRFAHLGDELIHRLGANITGKFTDEVELHGPFEFLIAQASATVEASAPTCYSSRRGYTRLLLPTWGGGRIDRVVTSKAEGRFAA